MTTVAQAFRLRVKLRPTAAALAEAVRPAGLTTVIGSRRLLSLSLMSSDPLHDGPVPAGLSDEQMREVRARYLAGASGSSEQITETFREWDGALEAFRRHQEVVLWFEHDLFDQLLLIRHLAWFARQSLGSTRLSLICIGASPEIDRFLGLGQLNPDQFANDDEMLPPGTVAMTDTGRDVRTGRMDWLAIRQFDRWLGGVHLRSGSMWRWNEDSGHVEKA